MTKQFDPAEHTVEEVNAHLEKATAAEQQRVLVAEDEGKARTTILAGPFGYEKDDDGDEKDADEFVSDSTDLAADVRELVADTREKLEKLIESHTKLVEGRPGTVGQEKIDYEIHRVGSTFPDLSRVLDMVAATADSLAAAAAAGPTVEG
jgi:di/tripeptidase